MIFFCLGQLLFVVGGEGHPWRWKQPSEVKANIGDEGLFANYVSHIQSGPALPPLSAIVSNWLPPSPLCQWCQHQLPDTIIICPTKTQTHLIKFLLTKALSYYWPNRPPPPPKMYKSPKWLSDFCTLLRGVGGWRCSSKGVQNSWSYSGTLLYLGEGGGPYSSCRTTWSCQRQARLHTVGFWWPTAEGLTASLLYNDGQRPAYSAVPKSLEVG